MRLAHQARTNEGWELDDGKGPHFFVYEDDGGCPEKKVKKFFLLIALFVISQLTDVEK